MFAYIVRRILQAIPILLGAIFVFFLIFNVVGGADKMAAAAFQGSNQVDPEAMDLVKKQMGLDKPLPIQYLNMVKQSLTLDFGNSIAQKRPIKKMIFRHAPKSLALTFPILIFQVVLGIIFSMICAFNRGKFPDKFFTYTSVIGMSVPVLVIIMLGQRFLAYKWGLFPIAGWRNGIGAIKYLILPWILMTIAGLGGFIRYYRTVFIDETKQDYVRTARAKGVSENAIRFKHVFKNAAIPFLTQVIMAIPFLIVGSFFVERFFMIPGLGFLTVASVQSYDFPVLIATVVIFTMFFIIFNTLTDILYGVFDPRVRLS